MADRLENALTFARKLSVTYGHWRDAKPDPTQAKACPICRKARKLVNDHDHESGYNRDWICALCNSGLGFFKDNPRALRRAARYLEKHKGFEKALAIHRHTKPSMDAGESA